MEKKANTSVFCLGGLLTIELPKTKVGQVFFGGVFFLVFVLAKVSKAVVFWWCFWRIVCLHLRRKSIGPCHNKNIPNG